RADGRFTSLPIVAMTAHATIEERNRCLAAGMNNHVAKPIDPAVLFDTLALYYKPSSAPPPAPVTAPAAPAAGDVAAVPSVEGLDTADGLLRVAGNRKLYMKLLRQFVEQQARTPAEISTALAAGDRTLATRLAHTAKGVAGNLGARAVQTAA